MLPLSINHLQGQVHTQLQKTIVLFHSRVTSMDIKISCRHRYLKIMESYLIAAAEAAAAVPEKEPTPTACNPGKNSNAT